MASADYVALAARIKYHIQKAEFCGLKEAESTVWLKEAAAAIEDLQKPKTGTWHRVKASKRSYMFVCNFCHKMYPYLTRCCPNCGVLYIDEEPPKEED